MDSTAWVSEITEETIKARWGIPALLRGKAFAAAGHVIAHEASLNGAIVATVNGGRNKVFRTVVRYSSYGLDSSCSCPLGGGCKHAVAVLLMAQAAAGTEEGSDWERALTPLLPPQAPISSDGVIPLGLEFNFRSLDEDPTSVQLRPLTAGMRGWVRNGWSELTSPFVDRAYEPRQLALIQQLTSLAGLSHGYRTPSLVPLGDFGPLVWALLRRLTAAGIGVVPGEGLQQVTLLDEDASLWLDATTAHDGVVHLAAVGSLGPVPSGGRRFLIGAPAHGIGELAGGHLRLTALTETVPEALRPLVNHGVDVTIPQDEVGRFRSLYLPVLNQDQLIRSSDGSVPVGERPRPVLTLNVLHEQEHRLRLGWGFRYGSQDVGALVGLRPDAVDPPRDYAAERQLEDAALGLLAGYPQWPGDMGAGLDAVTELEGAAAARFITDVVPQLELVGVAVSQDGVIPGYQQVLDAPHVILGATDTEDHDWFNLKVRVSVAGHEVDFEALFRALVAGDDAMLLDSGLWFTLDHPELDQLRQLIAEARTLADPRPDGQIRITPYQASLWEDLQQVGVTDDASWRWLERVEALLTVRTRETEPIPAGLEATLRPYQLDGLTWLATLWDAGLGGVLADDMGLGKTLQTLALIERARGRGDLDSGPVLVVAPASVVGTWVEEAARFTPHLRVVSISGAEKKRGTSLSDTVSGAHLVVTSYTLLRHEAEAYQALSWRGIVLDEAQFVKNSASVTYKEVRRISAPFTLAITGTPLENSLTDLWSMCSLAAPGLFPRMEAFAEQYRKPIENDGDAAALSRLRARLRPFMLRRTKTSVVAELPEKVEQIWHLELDDEHRRSYERHLTRERSRVLGMLDDMNRHRVVIFRALTKLRQLALDPRLVDPDSPAVPSVKVTAVVEQISELAQEGHRALVFSSFTGFLGLVRKALEDDGLDYVYLDGNTRDRQARITRFREGEAPVFLISLKAGGFGLTLTEADYVFVLDPWWNPAAEKQAIDRAHRIGQTCAVNVYKMVATNTIEDKVVALQQRKQALFDSVMETSKFRSGSITAEDIRFLLS